MYAIVETGGKQYRAEVGGFVEVELLHASEGDTVEFDRVLLVNDENGTRVGTPVIEGAKVKGEITATSQGPKLVVFKKRRRKGYQKKTGHRQDYSKVRITAIEA